MSNVKSNCCGSDDEYHDALDEMQNIQTTSQINTSNVSDQAKEQMIDEIIQKHSDLSILDDDALDGGASADGTDKKISVKGAELSDEELREFEKDLTEQQLFENKEKADKMKLEANECFKNDESDRAIEIYTDALNICPLRNTKERSVLFGNRAAAKVKLDAKKSAIEDCNKAIELWPQYVRVLLRRAKLYEQTDKLDEALEDYKCVIKIDPDQHDARLAIVRLPPLINQRNEKLKAEMMSSLKDLGNMILKPFGLSTNNFQMQQDPNTGSYSINFNQNSS